MHPRAALAAVLAAAAIAACSSPSPTFSLAAASVDPTYWCPGGASNAAYDLHATVDARNGTSREVTIQSATADMVLTSVSGAWLEKIGERYDAGAVIVTPASVAANSNAKLGVTIPSACTSARYGASASSSGRYAVTVRLVTSAGTFSVAAANAHEILAA